MQKGAICASVVLSLCMFLGGCTPEDYTPPAYKPKAGALLPQCSPDGEECRKAGSGLGMRVNGGLGVNLGGGVIMGFDGKMGFGFGF